MVSVMKIVRGTVDFVLFIAWVGAIALLWSDNHAASLWVLLLLVVPALVLLTWVLLMMPKVMDHPAAGGWDHGRAVAEVMGTYKQNAPVRIATTACALSAGAWMIYHGHGLSGWGTFYVIAKILRMVTHWIDMSKTGRGVGKALGLPITPEDDLEVPL